MSDQTKFNSQLEVTQTATLGGTLNVTGTTTFNDQVAIVATNDTVSIVATGVSITASTTITGSVAISGNTTITGDTSIEGDMTITGTVTINGDLSASSLLIGSSSRVQSIFTKSEQVYFDDVAGNAVGTHNAVVAGVELSLFNTVIVDTPDILNDAFLVTGVVTQDDTVSLKLHNTSNGTVEAITATFDIAVIQFS
jgi:cytoskeletal protein CcmA (bactofilin family)